MLLRSFVHAVLIAALSIIVYNYLGDFFVYFGEPVYLTSVYGKLKGRILKARGGREIYSFTSIPYAKPPLDDLRFEVLLSLCYFAIMGNVFFYEFPL